MSRLSRIAAFVAGCAAVLAAALPATAKPPLEAFGDQAEVRAVQLSPSGDSMAYILNYNGVEELKLHRFDSKTTDTLAVISDIKPRNIAFAGADHLILQVSMTARTSVFNNRYERGKSFSANIRTGKVVELMRQEESLLPGQSNMRIVGMYPDGKHVFMPAYAGDYRKPSYRVFRVNLDTGRASDFQLPAGTTNTNDWIMTASGEVLARGDFDDKTNEYSIHAYEQGRFRKVVTRKEDERTLSVLGSTPDGKALIVTDRSDSQFYSVYQMSLTDGSLSGPALQRSDADIEDFLMGWNRVLHGVVYAGLIPTYEIFDPAIENDVLSVQAQFAAASVSIDSWSDDWSKILFHVAGGNFTERYVLFDRKSRRLTLAAIARPSIKDHDVGEVMTIEYRASDGLAIPALVTWPSGVAKADRRNLPAIIMPHGGPEAYDSVGFDWLAQYFANEGYVVFQPNFRGSGGFGATFAAAGHRQWGRKMQTDISDGVNALVSMGWIDRERMCTVGWSYGGYAALAGGALTPDLYKCVVAIAGASDLRDMLLEEKKPGEHNYAYEYWTRHIGHHDKDREAIEAVSPSKLAGAFKAPVLLIHGTDDFVVPVRQSELMESALERAGKPVEFLRIKGDDHGLAYSDNRRIALETMSAFVAKHIGGRLPPPAAN